MIEFFGAVSLPTVAVSVAVVFVLQFGKWGWSKAASKWLQGKVD